MSSTATTKRGIRLLPVSLAGKITLGFSVIALLLIGNLINSYLDSIQTNKSLHKMENEALPIFSATTEISTLVQKLEPKILVLMSTDSSSKLTEQLNALDELSIQIAHGLSATDPDILSEPLASAVRTNLSDLQDSLAALDTAMTNMAETQKTLISFRQQITAASETLKIQEEAIQPLLSDIVYEMDDDYLISLMFEFSASANLGQFIIAKIQGATQPEEIEALQTELEDWIIDYKSVFRGLPSTAGEDPALYRELLLKLDNISNTILETAQGEYDQGLNGYINGLQSIKESEISQIAIQQKQLVEFRNLLSNVIVATQNMVDTGSTEMRESAGNIQALLGAQQAVGLASGILGLVLVLAISISLTRYFKKSVSELEVDLTNLEQGYLTVSHDIKRKDEFGKLIHAVNRVTQGLQDIVSGIGTANIEIHDGVVQVFDASRKTREYVEGQKTELDQVASALTQMAATASEVASHASDTHQKVSTAGELSTDGRQKVGNSRDMIVQVSKQAERTQAVISSLNDGVHGIESILATIGGIAEQTNLLALNAAIEAARAGEQGRGFAVVADEVRALASRTQSSTKEIQDMTDAMLKESNEAVTVMEKSAELIEQSVQSAQLADETIGKFDQLMNEVLDLSLLIATASEEQALTVNELNNNVLQVSTLAERTQDSAESSQLTSEQLRAMAETLKQKIARFKLD